MKTLIITTLLALAAVGAHAQDSVSSNYSGKVHQRVRPNIVWNGETSGLETVIAVHCAQNGVLLSAEIQHGSGNPEWDDAALKAVKRSDPMPRDTDGETPAKFEVTVRPAG